MSEPSDNHTFTTLLAQYAFTGKEAATADPSPKRKRTRSVTKAEAEAEADTPRQKSDRLSTAPQPSSTASRKKSSLTRKPAAGYSAPSVYAHLNTVPDYLAYGMRVLFVGINPGIASSTNQHHYANPTNAFWPGLSASGLVTQTVGWMDDSQLPQRYQLGLTNLVARPSRSSSEIRAAEFRAGRPVLDAKIRLWRPLVVCFIGKGIFEHWAGRACTTLGRQPETIALPSREEAAPDEMSTAHAAAMSAAEVHMAESLPAHECITAELGAHTDAHSLDAPTAARVARRRSTLIYAMPSTSGRVARITFPQKLTYFQQLCQLVEAEEAREQAEPADLSYR